MLELLRRSRTEVDRDILTNRQGLALALFNLGNLETAESILRDVVRIKSEVAGPDHPHARIFRNSLRVVLRASEPVLRERLSAQEQSLGLDHRETIKLTDRLAWCLAGLGRIEEATGLLEDALLRAQIVLPEGDLLVGSPQVHYGICLLELEFLGEAEEHLLAGHALLEQVLSDEHEQIRMAIRGLVRAYGLMDRPEDSARFQALLTPD